MKMQTYKLYFIFVLILAFSTLITAGNIIYQEGELRLEGEFDIESDGNSTTFISEDGGSFIIPKNNISLVSDSDEIETNSEASEQSTQKESAPITGAVIDSKSKNYIIPILIALIIIVGIFIGLRQFS